MIQLVQNDIYIGLFSRRQAGDFHWAIAVPIDLSTSTFVKFHAKNTAGGTWSYEQCLDSAQQNPITASLVCLVRIGNSGERSVADIDGILKQLDMATPRAFGGRKVAFNCRVWITMAVSALNDAGVIKCTDYKALDEECQRFGVEAEKAAAEGVSIRMSTLSK